MANSYIELLNTEVHYIKSDANRTDYKIYIQFPYNYKSNDKKYPVVYMLDAYWHFPVHYNEEFIIVGIGYKDYDPFIDNPAFDINLARASDLLPFPLAPEDIMIIPELAAHASNPNVSQAIKFKNFLQKELMVFINSNYRVSGSNILFGHSLAGLFVSWILTDYSDLFQKHIILSPALFWNNYAILNNIDKAKKWPSPTIFYLAVGEKETVHPSGINLVNDANTLFKRIKLSLTDNKVNFISNMDIIIKDEYHMSMVPSAIVKGLRFVLENPLSNNSTTSIV